MPTRDEANNEIVDNIKRKTRELKQAMEQLRNRQIEMAEFEARKMKRDAELNKAHNQFRSKDEKGNTVSAMDQIRKQAETLRNSGAETYKDWRANMMEIMNFFYSAGKLFNKQLTTNVFKVDDILNWIEDKVDIGVTQIKSSITPSVKLSPDTHAYYVDMAPDGVLTLSAGDEILNKLGVSQDAEGSAEFKSDIDAALKAIMDNWLWENADGYELKADGESGKFTIVDNDENKMSKEQFDELRNDPENGLEAYLASKGLMRVEPPRTAPTPSPFSS